MKRKSEDGRRSEKESICGEYLLPSSEKAKTGEEAKKRVSAESICGEYLRRVSAESICGEYLQRQQSQQSELPVRISFDLTNPGRRSVRFRAMTL